MSLSDDDDLLAGMDDDDLGDVDGFNLDGSFFLEDAAAGEEEEGGANFLSNMLAERATELSTIKEPTYNKSMRVAGGLSSQSFRRDQDPRIDGDLSDQAVAIATLKKRTMGSETPLSSVGDDTEPLLDPLAETNRNERLEVELIEDDDYLDLDKGRRKLNIMVGAWTRVYRERIAGSSIVPDSADFTSIDAAASHTFPPPEKHPKVDTLIQILRDTERAQQARLRKIRQLLQDGEKGLADGVFALPSRSTTSAAVGSASKANEEASNLRAELEDLQSSSSLDFSDDFKMDEEDEGPKESKEEGRRKDEKAKRKSSRREKRAQLRSRLTQLASGGGATSFDGTATGITRTLEALGLGGSGTSLDGLLFKIVSVIKLIHDEMMEAFANAEDGTNFRKDGSRSGNNKSMDRSDYGKSVDIVPIRALGFGSKGDEIGGVVDSITSQGFELALLFVNACDKLPGDDDTLPDETHEVLESTLRSWRTAYPLTAFFSLKMIIAANAQQALPYCAAVLKHADAFQSKTVEMAMVCVAEAAIDGVLTDCILWITPVLAVLRMLAQSATLNEDLLTLALDVLMFAVVGEGNAAVQFIKEGGASVLASVLLVVDPNEVKPEVVKRILKLLNPTSLGVPKAACLGKPRSQKQTPSQDSSINIVAQGTGANTTPVSRQRTTTFIFPAEEVDSHRQSADEADLANSPSLFAPSQLEEAAAKILFEDDFDDIINAVIIALDKYDGRDMHRNAQAQQQAHDDKVATQKRQYEAAAQQAKSDKNAAGGNKLQTMRSISFIAPPQPVEPKGPPASADNQVLEECTFIIYSIINADPDYAVRKSVMQPLCRQVIGSDVFWNNADTMKGVLACIQQFLAAFHAVSAVHTDTSKQGDVDYSFGKVSTKEDPTTASYYRGIMDAPTLATLALSLRCFAMEEVSNVQPLGTVYKMLYLLVAAEPSRSLLVQGCCEEEEDSLSNSGRLTRRKSIADYASSDNKVGGPSRRTSLQMYMPSKEVPPHNALIPCLLHCLSRSPYSTQKRLCVTLLNRVCKGAFKPACTQLLGVLPAETILGGKTRNKSRAMSVNMTASLMPETTASEDLPLNAQPSTTSLPARSPSIAHPPWIGGVSSGTICSRSEAPGAFLRFFAKFIGTATPELVPALLALIREIGRFLSSPANGDAFDQSLLQNILSSVLSILNNFSQEAVVVAGSCLTLAHLCRIPHPLPPPASSLRMEGSVIADALHIASRPTSASFRMFPVGLSSRLNISDPTPLLTFAFENDVLDMAVGLIGATYLHQRRTSNIDHHQPETVGPSPMVRRTLGFLLAVLAIDAEAIPTIVEEGGLPLIAEAGGVAKSMGLSVNAVPTSSLLRRSNSVVRREEVHSSTTGGFLAVGGGATPMNRTVSMRSTTGKVGETTVASVLSREEKDFCRRQAKRVHDKRERSNQTPVESKLKRVVSDMEGSRHTSHTVTALLTNQLVTVQLDCATAAEHLREQERDQRHSIETQREASYRHLEHIQRKAHQDRRTQREVLLERFLEIRSETLEYEREAFMNIMRYAAKSLQKRASFPMHTQHVPTPPPSATTSEIPPNNLQEILGAIAKMQEQQMKLQSEMMIQSNQQMLALAAQQQQQALPLSPMPPSRPHSASARSFSPNHWGARPPVRPTSSSFHRLPSPLYEELSDSNQQLIRYVEQVRRNSSTAGVYTSREFPDPFDVSASSRCASPAGHTLSSETADRRRQEILRRNRPPTAPTRVHDRSEFERDLCERNGAQEATTVQEGGMSIHRLHQLIANARGSEIPGILTDPTLLDPTLLTVLDFSRNYLGDSGLRELLPTLKEGVPNLRRISLRQNGLTGGVLHELLFDTFGVPPPPPSEVMWSSPRPAPVLLRASSRVEGTSRTVWQRRQERLHQRVTEASSLAPNSDPTAEVASAVVQFLTFVRDDVVDSAHAQRLEDPSAPKSLRTIDVMLPAGHVLVEGVALLLPLLEMNRLLNAALEDAIRSHNTMVDEVVPPEGERWVHIPSVKVNLVLPGHDSVSDVLDEEDPGWHRSFLFSPHVSVGSYKKIESIDLSNNPGIAPRSNRTLVTYLRQNPYLMRRSTFVEPTPPPPRPPSAISVVRARDLAGSGLVVTPRGGKDVAEPGIGETPLLVGGTQLFQSTTTLIQQISEQRTFRMGMLYELIRSKFAETTLGR